MRDKTYSETEDDYDYYMDRFRVHSTVAAVPETYAIRCYRDDNGKPALDEKLVLFWALLEWESSNTSGVTMQRFVPVLSNGGGGGTSPQVSVSGPEIEEDLLGYASRQQLEEKDGLNSREEWLRSADEYLTDVDHRNERYRKERDEKKALENPSLS